MKNKRKEKMLKRAIKQEGEIENSLNLKLLHIFV
jgi:hypothetical protein